jgi:hypothetical protein
MESGISPFYDQVAIMGQVLVAVNPDHAQASRIRVLCSHELWRWEIGASIAWLQASINLLALKDIPTLSARHDDNAQSSSTGFNSCFSASDCRVRFFWRPKSYLSTMPGRLSSDLLRSLSTAYCGLPASFWLDLRG